MASQNGLVPYVFGTCTQALRIGQHKPGHILVTIPVNYVLRTAGLEYKLTSKKVELVPRWVNVPRIAKLTPAGKDTWLVECDELDADVIKYIQYRMDVWKQRVKGKPKKRSRKGKPKKVHFEERYISSFRPR